MWHWFGYYCIRNKGKEGRRGLVIMTAEEFSFKTRTQALERFQKEEFDLLVIGGGITGAATARDATSRGLKVALVERRDFAWGTSSRSSKLIHGGLRYLENLEFPLVFEALSERSHLLKSVPHLVKPLPFYMPIFKEDAHGKFYLGLGMWLYDILSLFRSPGFHKNLSKKRMLRAIPFLKADGLKGGFYYYDASMWDDLLAVETLRSAKGGGAVVANYVEAVSPLWQDGSIKGFKVRDKESPESREIDLRAKRVVVCVGPWVDEIGIKLSSDWKDWLTPSKGVHLIFDLKRIPVPGAMVMSNPDDKRIAFVIPRPDYGAGVAIVGTTDGPTPRDPEKATIEPSDITYLVDLLARYFPKLNLQTSDILSAYVGVRPLMGPLLENNHQERDHKGDDANPALHRVSREHFIGTGPGNVVLVAGGKYTTHRTMAKEIVDYTLEVWKGNAKKGKAEFPSSMGSSHTRVPVNPRTMPKAVKESQAVASKRGWSIPKGLENRYGAEALDILEINIKEIQGSSNLSLKDPDGFPFLAAQLCHAMRTEMVMHLEDFFLRRVPLFLSRDDHGLPWAEGLSRIWAKEKGGGEAEAREEVKRLKEEIERRSCWKKKIDI